MPGAKETSHRHRRFWDGTQHWSHSDKADCTVNFLCGRMFYWKEDHTRHPCYCSFTRPIEYLLLNIHGMGPRMPLSSWRWAVTTCACVPVCVVMTRVYLIEWLCAHGQGPFCVQLHQLSRPCTHHAVSVVSLVTYGADSNSRQWCCPAFHAPPAWKVLAAATCSPAMIKQQVVTMHITIHNLSRCEIQRVLQ